MYKSLQQMTCVEDLRRLAKKRVPQMFYDYVDAGSWSETTYRANAADLAAIMLRQRVACDVSSRSQQCELAGHPATMPVAIAPTGIAGMQHADGEILAARAAARFGVPFTLSTMSVCSIEDVARHTGQPFWFQLYMMKDRRFIERLVRRARDANCGALMLTLDLPVQGQRHKDIRNGLSTPPKPTVRNLIDMLCKPYWWAGMLQTKRRSFGNIVGFVDGVSDVSSMAEWVSGQFDQTVSWEDVRWIRSIWDRKLIVKGIMDAGDAELAWQCGADALVVSNHGGRQLDGAPSSIAALPAIVAAVGSRIEVLFDGGITSGQDVMKAVALGAKGTLIGRAFLYGLGALGEAGVSRCLEILHRELDLSMALCGVTNIEQVTKAVLVLERP